jgi:Skp family chaperone for outer membrane proteins
MLRKLITLLTAMALASLSLQSLAAKGDEKGPSDRAYEHASDNASFKRDRDYDADGRKKHKDKDKKKDRDDDDGKDSDREYDREDDDTGKRRDRLNEREKRRHTGDSDKDPESGEKTSNKQRQLESGRKNREILGIESP